MSLNNILKTIESESEKEAEEIINNGEKEALKIETLVEEESKKEQKKILAQFKVEMEKRVKQIKFQKESAKKTALLKKKRKILDNIYEQVVELVIGDNELYGQAIKKIIAGLPQTEDSEITLADNNPERTKTALGAAQLKYKISDKNIGSKGGFILKSKILEIDNTIETLILQTRAETEVEASEILFNE